MSGMAVRIGAAAGACAVAAGVLIGTTMAHDDGSVGIRAEPSEPTTEVTETDEQIAPSEPAIEKAEPQIIGPAPLPPEEQGLPGNH